MNTVVLIQARLGSTRLPRKVLEPIAGLPAIAHTALRCFDIGRTFILCPESDIGALSSAILPSWVFGWVGPESDVLGRFAAFVRERPAITTIVRVTGDCPFIDPATIRTVAHIVESGAADFATTNPAFNEPGIDGYDVEAFTRGLLMEAHSEVGGMFGTPYPLSCDGRIEFHTNSDREHVTPWMRRNARNPFLAHRMTDTRHRWTLDTAEDLAWFRRVAAEIDCTPPHPTYAELLALLERKPELRRVNP